MPGARPPVTVPALLAAKREGQRIVMLTAYDATFARLADQAGADIVLVGDSLGMVMQGHEHTLEVTLEQMIYHCQCVRRGLRVAHLVLDLPFMTYQAGPDQALQSAGRAIKEGRAAAVKVEGGEAMAESIRRIVGAGIPVMGHLGLTPQSVHAFGGFKVQAKDEAAAQRLRADAKLLEQAGCYSLVLEGIPAPLAQEVSESLTIPTIGIGAGVGCDGQVLVMHDLLGLEDRFKPRFVKRYAQLAQPVREAFGRYAQDVRGGSFPTDAHSFSAGAPKPVAPPSIVAVSGAQGDGEDGPAGGGYGPQ